MHGLPGLHDVQMVGRVNMAKGKVKWFSDSKGYGFIQTEEDLNSGKDIFVHYSEIVKEGYKSLFQGQAVEFELSETSNGLQAKRVEPIL